MSARILIVEDEAIIADDLRRALVRLGYEVCAVTDDGAEAVALSQSHRPALVLMDIHLAGSIDGIEAASAIRGRYDVPVVFLTAYSDEATLHRAKLAEPLSYLLKPFDERELRTAIELGLYLHRIAQERRALLERVRHQERLASLGTLSAGIAHEVNNPLSVIVLNTDLARMTTRSLELTLGGVTPKDGTAPATADTRAIDELLVEVGAAAERIRRIVDDVRQFARAESHKAGPVEPSRLVDAAVALARKTIEQRARLFVEHAPAPHIQGSESLLMQVLLNLLTNASQALSRKTPAAGKVVVRTGTAPDGRAFIAVEDNGMGIPAELVGRVFDPFFTTKAPGEGTGLGLSISHGIVTSHEGEIVVHSTEGVGTTMTVLFPALGATATPANAR